MADPITVEGRTYHHHSRMVPADGSVSPLRDQAENRQFLFKKKKKLPLDRTAGAYVRLGGRDVLLIVDRRTVDFDSPEWRLIADTAARLEQCHAALSPQGQAALARLRAVIFSRKPLRSFAEVKPDIFFYDVDEFRRADGSLVASSWTASCVVHDANHIWQHDNRKPWHGVAGEVPCWQLQVDNRGALGLSQVDVDHLNSFIADPAKILDRAGSGTFEMAELVRSLFRGRRVTPCYLPPPEAAR